jgi:hypothetical protein
MDKSKVEISITIIRALLKEIEDAVSSATQKKPKTAWSEERKAKMREYWQRRRDAASRGTQKKKSPKP